MKTTLYRVNNVPTQDERPVIAKSVTYFACVKKCTSSLLTHNTHEEESSLIVWVYVRFFFCSKKKSCANRTPTLLEDVDQQHICMIWIINIYALFICCVAPSLFVKWHGSSTHSCTTQSPTLSTKCISNGYIQTLSDMSWFCRYVGKTEKIKKAKNW